MTETFDAIIVGAGQAGPALAGRLTDAGMTVALIERDRIGGTCVNTGCTPTKAMVASARAAHVARHASDFGLDAGPVSVDMRAVVARAEAISASSRGRNEQWLRTMSGLTLIHGHARFAGPDIVEVSGRRLAAPKIFLNVGSRPHISDIEGAGSVGAMDSSAILNLRDLPDHLLVVGGSYIGLEFAQIFRRFGSQVTIVERAERLIAREDAAISDAVRALLEKEGIAVHTGANCIRLAGDPSGVAVIADCDTDERQWAGSHVLVATGRRPNTDDLGLEFAGIATDKRGFVEVNDRLETSAPGIWALGDCNGRGAFTHTAWNDFEIVSANLLDGTDRSVAQRIPGYALYIDPPLGRVGLTEEQARASGRSLLVASRPMTRVGRAIEKGETEGLMTLVADAETRQILGAAILGVGGDEAIHAILNLMNVGASLEALQWAVPIHPTVAELLPTLARDLAPA